MSIDINDLNINWGGYYSVRKILQHVEHIGNNFKVLKFNQYDIKGGNVYYFLIVKEIMSSDQEEFYTTLFYDMEGQLVQEYIFSDIKDALKELKSFEKKFKIKDKNALIESIEEITSICLKEGQELEDIDGNIYIVEKGDLIEGTYDNEWWKKENKDVWNKAITLAKKTFKKYPTDRHEAYTVVDHFLSPLVSMPSLRFSLIDDAVDEIYLQEKVDNLQENFNEVYLEMLKGLTDKDYKLMQSYYRDHEVLEIIRMDQYLSVRDKIETISIKGQMDIYFTANKEILPNYKMKIGNKDPKFHLYEMTYETYNRLGF